MNINRWISVAILQGPYAANKMFTYSQQMLPLWTGPTRSEYWNNLCFTDGADWNAAVMCNKF